MIPIGTRVRFLAPTGTAADVQRGAEGRTGVVVAVGTRRWRGAGGEHAEPEYLVEAPDGDGAPLAFWWHESELEVEP